MSRYSQAYYRQTSTNPIRTQSPDLRSGNRIKPTKSPENIDYIIRQTQSVQRTPNRNEQQKGIQSLQKSRQNLVISKYFAKNRSGGEKISSSYSHQTNTYAQSKSRVHTNPAYCQNCCSGYCHCMHATHNEEVIIQLRRIITMMSQGQNVSAFNPDSQEWKKQNQILKVQNSKLLQLVEKLKLSSDQKIDQSFIKNYESQIRILRQQMSQTQNEHQRQREQLYRTNKTLSSQLKSLQDKNYTNQKELNTLKSIIKVKQQNQLSLIKDLKQQQSKKKSFQDKEKLSLSMIKDQYNESVKTLRLNISVQIENKLRDYQNQIREYQMRIDTLDERLKNYERINEINKKLFAQNKALRQMQKKPSEQRLIEQQNNIQQLARLQKQNQDKSQYITLLSKQIEQSKSFYNSQINDLKTKNSEIQQKINKETQTRVKMLMENYEQEIRILKKQPKSATCNHKGIEQENANLREENDKNWQQVIKLRNQLARYTAECSKLQAEISNSKIQINKLSHQISDDKMNLSARTSLLQGQNSKLLAQLNSLTILLQAKDKQINQSNIKNSKLFEDNEKLYIETSLLKNQINRLNHIINNDQLNLTARTTLLQNQNARLRQELHQYQTQKFKKDNKESVQSLIDELTRVKSENNRLSSEVKSSILHASSIRQDDEKQITKLKNQILQKEDHIISLQSELSSHKIQIGKLNNSVHNEQMNQTARVKLFQSQIQRLKGQLSRNEKLARQVPALQQQNNLLKQRLSNFPNVDTLTSQLHQSKVELEQNLAKISTLQTLVAKLQNQLNSSKTQITKKELQSRFSYNKQFESMKITYENQLQALREENNKISHSYDVAIKQNQDIKIFYQEQRKNKIDEHEITIRNLSKIVEQTQINFNKIQQKLQAAIKQNQQLKQQIRNLKISNEATLRQNSQSWQNQISLLKNDHNNQIYRLKQLLKQKQSEEEFLIKRVNSRISTFKNESLRKQLEQLKRLIDQARYDRIQQQMLKLSEDYQRELIRSEQKTMQIDSLTKDKLALDDKVADLQRLRLVLDQKINTIEGNIKILENELKERKILCENLMNQKIILEKQNIMLKKIKLDKQSIEATKAKAKQISLKIERLLALQQQRQKSMAGQEQIEYSQVITESVTRRAF